MSPILFPHLPPGGERQVSEVRGKGSREEEGVVWKWIPASSFAGKESNGRCGMRGTAEVQV